MTARTAPGPSSYEKELDEQPRALRRFAGSELPDTLADIDLTSYSRVVLTGMGSSHIAALPLWRTLVRAGFPVWWVSTTELLDSPALVSSNSLVVMTSQSGRSGEVVAAVQGAVPRPRTLVAVTNDPDSPLAAAAQVCVELRAGTEATVSAKSYLNTLAAHRRLAVIFTGGDPLAAVTDILVAADDLEFFECGGLLDAVASTALGAPSARVALVGWGDGAATALLGGLILKEAAKVAAQGYVGGEFRHGPLEIAGPGLTAVIFAAGRRGEATTDPPASAVELLAADLVAAGSQTLIVGGTGYPGAHHLSLPSHSPLGALVLSANVTQTLSVALARTGGLVPGEFSFGQKITSKL